MRLTESQIERLGFWQEWHQIILFFSVFLSLIAGIYFWSKYQYEQPIDAIYKEYLDLLANASPAARGYEENYLQSTRRSTVASQDFLMLCSGMVYAAKRENIDAYRFNQNLTTLCENSAVYINHDFLSH